MQRHGVRMEMLGLGGFRDLTTPLLAQMLQPARQTMAHLGIGGCEALLGAAALHEVCALCPNLEALNVHQVNGMTVAAVVELLRCCTSLVSLDCHSCGWELSELPRAREQDILAGWGKSAEAWTALGRPYGDRFCEADVMCEARNAVRLAC
eukprot:6413351-Prymnesium_polylepis.1